MKAYKTSDGHIWLIVGYIKRTPVGIDWTGRVRKLTKPYRKAWQQTSRQIWLGQRKASIMEHCVNPKLTDYTKALRKAVQHKKYLNP